MELTLKRKPATPAPSPADLGGATYPIPDPTKPSALLLPPFIHQRRAEAKAKKTVLRIAASVVTVCALAGAGTFALAHMADQDLTVARAEKKVADDKVNKYRAIAAYHDGLKARQAALTAALAGDIAYSTVTDTVLDAAPAGVEISGVKYQPGVPCASPDPFVVEAALGCITVSGAAESSSGVGAFVDALNATTDTGPLVGAFASAVTSTTGGSADFTVSVNYGTGALSYKYVDETQATGVPGADPTAPLSGATGATETPSETPTMTEGAQP